MKYTILTLLSTLILNENVCKCSCNDTPAPFTNFKFSEKKTNTGATCTDTLCTYKTLSSGGNVFYNQQADKVD